MRDKSESARSARKNETFKNLRSYRRQQNQIHSYLYEAAQHYLRIYGLTSVSVDELIAPIKARLRTGYSRVPVGRGQRAYIARCVKRRALDVLRSEGRRTRRFVSCDPQSHRLRTIPTPWIHPGDHELLAQRHSTLSKFWRRLFVVLDEYAMRGDSETLSVAIFWEYVTSELSYRQLEAAFPLKRQSLCDRVKKVCMWLKENHMELLLELRNS